MSTVINIDQMTLEEKLRAMEALWDDLCRHEEDVQVPQWHKEVLDDRERLIEEGKAQFTDWETAKKRIGERTS
jgi:hypothetical protein